MDQVLQDITVVMGRALAIIKDWLLFLAKIIMSLALMDTVQDVAKHLKDKGGCLLISVKVTVDQVLLK